MEERRQEQYDSLLEEWRDATEISVDEKVWNKIDFIDQGVTIITSEEEDTSTDSSSSTDESTTDNGSADDGSSADDGTSENTDTSGDDTAE